MRRLTRLTMTLVALLVVAGAADAAAPGASMELIIANGPHAGTFKYPGKGIFVCMRQKSPDQLSAVYKDMDANDISKVSGVGFNVFSPDAPGVKSGGIRIVFGDPFNKKQSPTYEIMIPRDSAGPLVMTRSGKTVSLAFTGQTKDGIKVQLKMFCDEVGSIP